MIEQDSSIIYATDRKEYFDGIAGFLHDDDFFGTKILIDFLNLLDLSDYDQSYIPNTQYRAKQKIISATPAHRFWFECLQNGKIASDSIATPSYAWYNEYVTTTKLKVYNDDLYSHFLNWAKKNHVQAGSGQHFTRTLGQIVSFTTGYTMADSESMHAERRPYRAFESLEECRRMFAIRFAAVEFDSTRSTQPLVSTPRPAADIIGEPRFENADGTLGRFPMVFKFRTDINP